MRCALLRAADRMVGTSPLATASRNPKSAASTATPLASCPARKRMRCSAKRRAGTQLLRGARLDGAARADQHCGQRHSLRDDHQADDQHEKPFAETTHEIGSNMSSIVRARRCLPRGFECGNETSDTTAPHLQRPHGGASGAAGAARRLRAGRAPPWRATLVINVQTPDGHALAGAVVTVRPLDARAPACPPPVHAVMDQVESRLRAGSAGHPGRLHGGVPEQRFRQPPDLLVLRRPSASSCRCTAASRIRRCSFDQTGVVTLGCNIHDDMLAYLLVTDAPYFGRTDAQGSLVGGRAARPLPRRHLASAPARERRGPGARAHRRRHRSRRPDAAPRRKRCEPAPLTDRPHSWDY